MEPFKVQKEEYFVIDDWMQNERNLVVGFTSKNGGASKEHFTSLNLGLHVEDKKESVLENREHLAKVLSFPLDHWVGAQQTHETNIVKVTKRDQGKGASKYEDAFKHTDGFFTFESGTLLTLCYADCVPLYFFHPGSKAIGIAHAGWKGTVHGIAERMVQCFQSEGIDASEILVAIGPSICENCYIVNEPVIKLVKNILEDVDIKPYNLISDDQYTLDLKECNKQILLKSGVSSDHILTTNLCTSCQKDHFFSHRRDHGKTGRMMSFIGLKEDL